ncbi:MAG: MauE/DoxX family redox-associated membrane protein [Mycobacteriales bacterium]
MELLAGPYLASALLLVAAGVLKTARPGATALALRSVGARIPTAAVRAGGGAEAMLGAGAVLLGGRLIAIAVGASYAAFAAFVVVALRRGGVVSSCGCFGTPDTPPTVTHVGVTLAAASVGFAFATGGAHGLPTVVADQPLAGVPFVFALAACAWLGYLLLAVLPTVRRPRATA